jgi:hypothetical protein
MRQLVRKRKRRGEKTPAEMPPNGEEATKQQKAAGGKPRRKKPLTWFKFHAINQVNVEKGGIDYLAAPLSDLVDVGPLRLLSSEEASERKKLLGKLSYDIHQEKERLDKKHQKLLEEARVKRLNVYELNGKLFEVPSSPVELRGYHLSYSPPKWTCLANSLAERKGYRQYIDLSLHELLNASQIGPGQDGTWVVDGTRKGKAESTAALRGHYVVQSAARAHACFGPGGKSQVLAQWADGFNGSLWPNFWGISILVRLQEQPKLWLHGEEGALRQIGVLTTGSLDEEIDLMRKGQPGSQESARFSLLVAYKNSKSVLQQQEPSDPLAIPTGM